MMGEGRKAVRIGLLRLTDAAPVVVAAEKGFFAERGLDVRLSVEPSWSNIADKLTFRQLDAAVMLPPLAFAVSLGLRGAGIPLIVPMSLSLNGNSVTVSKAIAKMLSLAPRASVMEVGGALRDYLKSRAYRPRLAVVHVYSTHNLLLRYWLAAAGIDPDKDVELSVIPPAEMVDALGAGRIDGFCAGAPWGEAAARADAGRTIVASSEIWRNHPEKCLAVGRDWAAGNPATLELIMGALLDAARFCDAPANAEEIASILGRERYLDLEPALIRESLPIEDAPGPYRHSHVDRSVFFAHAATFPWRSHAAWFLQEMTRWGQLSGEVDARSAADSVYRSDLYRAAALKSGILAPIRDRKAEGAHAVSWRAEGSRSDIEMGPDLFCDGRIFPG